MPYISLIIDRKNGKQIVAKTRREREGNHKLAKRFIGRSRDKKSPSMDTRGSIDIRVNYLPKPIGGMGIPVPEPPVLPLLFVPVLLLLVLLVAGVGFMMVM